MRAHKRVSNEQRVLTALRQRRLVTRKTALQKGWCEDLTRTISRLRKEGHIITSLSCVTDEGERYTKYVLEFDNTFAIFDRPSIFSRIFRTKKINTRKAA